MFLFYYFYYLGSCLTGMNELNELPWPCSSKPTIAILNSDTSSGRHMMDNLL